MSGQRGTWVGLSTPTGHRGRLGPAVVTATIQSPSRINGNHPEPIRNKQQPSRGHLEITATIQSPSRINNTHPEPIRN